MNYRIKRGEQEFGPYSLAELKQYLGEGRIVPTDLALSEGMEAWTPVSQVIGDVGLAQAAPALVGPSGAFATGASPGLPAVPPPPGLHWALILLLAVVTCGIFSLVWMFIQANWARKIDRQNKSMLLFVVYLVAALGAGFVGGVVGALGMEAGALQGVELVTGIVNLAAIVCLFIGYFKIKGSMEDAFGGPPLHLRMSGVMTFFFNVFYIQYHFTRINELYTKGMAPMGTGN